VSLRLSVKEETSGSYKLMAKELCYPAEYRALPWHDLQRFAKYSVRFLLNRVFACDAS